MNNYTKYSLQQLDEWVHDALNNEELTSDEIYNQITQTIREHIDYHTKNANKGTSLLNLLSSDSLYSTSFPPYNWNYEIPTELSSQDIWDDEKSVEQLQKWYDECVMPSATQRDIDREAETIQDKKYVAQYTEEELNAMCDAAESQQAKELCHEYNEREAEYYSQKEQVNKWVLPVELSYVDGEEDYIIGLPNDLLEKMNWKEGDQLEWISQNDNSYILKKLEQ